MLMRFAIVGDLHIVTLSRRNLLGLLAKLDDPQSLRTLTKLESSGLHLVVHAESDEEHYSSRPEGPPGPMIDRTEQQLIINRFRTFIQKLLDHAQWFGSALELDVREIEGPELEEEARKLMEDSKT